MGFSPILAVILAKAIYFSCLVSHDLKVVAIQNIIFRNVSY